jgi:hypothetical protein
MKVKTRVARILKPLLNFRPIKAGSLAVSPSLPAFVLKEGEECYGVYENLPAEAYETVAVTNLGLHVLRKKKWQFVDYRQIRKVDLVSPKRNVSELLVRLTNQESVLLPIRGGKGRFRDAFEFMRFIDRVTSDLRAKKLSDSWDNGSKGDRQG